MVGRGGLEPPASELDTAGRCANESGAASESRRVMCCARSQTLKGWWWPQTYPTRILQVQRAHLRLEGRYAGARRVRLLIDRKERLYYIGKKVWAADHRNVLLPWHDDDLSVRQSSGDHLRTYPHGR